MRFFALLRMTVLLDCFTFLLCITLDCHVTSFLAMTRYFEVLGKIIERAANKQHALFCNQRKYITAKITAITTQTMPPMRVLLI